MRAGAAEQSGVEQPNVVFILADDMGYMVPPAIRNHLTIACGVAP